MASESYHPRVNFDEEDMPPPRQSPISRVGGALGKSVVTVWRNTTPDAVKDVWRLARWETQNVRCWRTLIFFLLLITGAFVSSYTYVFLRREQESDFEANYNLFAHRIEYSIGEESQAVVVATQNMARTISGAAASTNSSFPTVSVPLFEITGYTARHEASLEMISYTPIVTEGERTKWQSYAIDQIGWIEESRAFLGGKQGDSKGTNSTNRSVRPFIWQQDETGNAIPAYPAPYLPIWQTTPPPAAPDLLINFNMLSVPYVYNLFRTIVVTREGALSPLEDFAAHIHAIENAEPLPPVEYGFVNAAIEERRSVYVQPVFGSVTDSASYISGLVHTLFAWQHFMDNILPSDAQGVYVVLKNTCGQEATYKIMGDEAFYLGFGDLHERHWGHLEHSFVLSNIVSEASMEEGGHCVYSFFIYPSDELRDVWRSLTPLFFGITAAGAFFLIAITFITYDRYVIRRNEKMIDQAARTNKIVASLFPSNVRARLLAEDDKEGESGTQTRLKNFLANDGPSKADLDVDDNEAYKTRPIADLFPECSVLYADIAGFTSWSSAREPNHVFTLLETIYRAFDEIAKAHNVYKVETIGDCYVACTGLPEPRPDHAVAMSQFALECLDRMHVLVKKLEVHLGPDTADLAMRIGIHSGPVTAGVLRGDRSRFQLFGDTVNKAAKMESSGKRDYIQVSEETADLLKAYNLGQWLVPRQEAVSIMGKGEMKTYWLQGGGSAEEVSLPPSSMAEETAAPTQVRLEKRATMSESTEFQIKAAKKEAAVLDERVSRRADWVAEVLIGLLKRVIAKRGGKGQNGKLFGLRRSQYKVDESVVLDRDGTVLEEVQELIALPDYDPTCKLVRDADSVVLDPDVDDQVHAYVKAVASMYRKNPFHNFEHCSHVTMSVSKLLSRIVAPSDMDFKSSFSKNVALHDHTYGITSDPLTQFACVFSALIHDVDHTGVPNTVLSKEDPAKSKYYKDRSVAEQNSVDLAWEMLMQEDFRAFREALYTTQEELLRFRQLVVNSVMATDIMDKDLKELRNARWERAFSETSVSDPVATRHRKATIVIEHLIQASDVAHTMQHWHVYRKWNERLFMEMYKAYKEGRTEKDPSEFWYKGELGFFDFYIIPLAKKLKDCGVFGVSSDEYLNYSMKNRRQWESRGQQVVEEYMEIVKNMK